MSSSVPGTNVPPVSFPGIASGIDYNAIITKLTSLTLSQNVSLNAQIATLNSANTELIKINNLLNCVQSALGNLSDPLLFNSWSATSSNTSEGSASVISGQTPIAGTYTITAQTAATATSITNNSAAGHSILDGGSNNVVIANSYVAITPTNGSGSAGSVTVNGVTVSYNVNTDSVQSILTRIQNGVQAATGDASFTATLNASGQVVISSTQHPISLGAPSDQGNILQVFKLTGAQINNTGTSGSVTSTSDIGGINQAASFTSSSQAGYQTAVTSGYFTINGVKITVDAAGDNTASLIARINSSNAGVIASYDSNSNHITLTATATGPQNIVVGAAGDTSNFLTAAGLTSASGATTTVGTQASVTVQNPAGVTNTVYSSSNSVTTAINGVTLNIGAGFSTPYTISVASDSSKLVSALNTFVSAYNGAITEINNATVPPAVISPQTGASTTVQSAAVGGGVLWNSEIQNVKDQLTSLVTGFFGNGSTGYNSLSSIGLQLTDSFTILSTAANGSQNASSSQPVQTQQLQGTDGTFQPLDVSKLQAALSANSAQVQQLFQGSTSITNQLGNYLGLVTGLPTLLNNGIVGSLPSGGTAIIQGFENTNNDQISSITDQIKRITDSANQQADMLRQEFTATEGQLAVYQSLQQQLGGFLKGNGG
ncbi:MAG TPA: flagellar filament capping protein FliD [Candidatus Aquilonibacter sp.]|nr:flagellar filament capping protein FliD [Candidatus Aquilonibacter sp.]